MDGEPFTVAALVNNTAFAETLIDTGCLSYGLCDPKFASKNRLQRLKIAPRSVTGVDGKLTAVTDEVVAIELDLDGHEEERVFLYVSPIGHYDMILGMPWVVAQDARINGPRSEMKIMSTGTVLRSQEAFRTLEASSTKAVQVSPRHLNTCDYEKARGRGRDYSTSGV
jgi:predicted aspartyl protease